MGLLNEEYFNNLEQRIDSINQCNELNELIAETQKELEEQLIAVIKQIEILAPIIEIPTDLSSVINWITSYIALINNSYTEAIQLQIELTAKFTRIMSKISQKSQSLTCNITIPQVPELS